MVDFQLSNTLKILLNQIIDGKQQIEDTVLKEIPTIDFLQTLIHIHYTEGLYDISDIHNLIHHYNIHSEIELQHVYVSLDDDHPLNILIRENDSFNIQLNSLKDKLPALEVNKDSSIIENELQALSKVYAHYNRKEKLLFPLLERHQIYTLPRKMWALDDDIRSHYNQLRNRIKRIHEIEFRHIKTSFDLLFNDMHKMMLYEEDILIPFIQELFNEADFVRIANESAAFGYAVNVNRVWNVQSLPLKQRDESIDYTQNIKIGGGYLTLKEAELILNNLPVEITFVDKNGLFKYFNEITSSANMMFIRTPLSIGLHVANCHPPKSLKKVMKIMRMLKNKEESSVTMWFKKGDEFIYVTYKALFDEHDEYQGILEYVQDIQPFIDLPKSIKRDIN
ncbi:PAS domain-containing protein [Macrococcus sp. FSL R5-0951]